MTVRSSGATWPRRLAGLACVAAWVGWLWLAGAPWRDLGGLVDERTRWLGRFVVGPGLLAGALAGLGARRRLRAGRAYPATARRLFYPIGLALALGLAIAGRPGSTLDGGIAVRALVVLGAGSALAAGADLTFRIRPLLDGRRPRDPDAPADALGPPAEPGWPLR